MVKSEHLESAYCVIILSRRRILRNVYTGPLSWCSRDAAEEERLASVTPYGHDRASQNFLVTCVGVLIKV